MVELSWPAILGLSLAVLAAWSGIFIWALSWMLGRERTHVDARFETMEMLVKSGGDKAQELERRFLELKVDIAEHYVHRDDWIRSAATIHRKLDMMWDAVDDLRLEQKPPKESDDAS